MYEYDLVYDGNTQPKLKIKKDFDEGRGILIKDLDEVVELINKEYDLRNLYIEYNFLICFSSEGYFLGYYVLGKGDHKSVSWNQKELLLATLLMNGESVATLHNHPGCEMYKLSGSDADHNVKEQEKETLEIVDVEYIGSYIATGEGWREIDDTGEWHEWILSEEEVEE